VPGQRKKTDDKLADLVKKQEQLKAQLDALKTRKKAEDRRRETRRAFLVGSAVLARAESDPSIRDVLRTTLEAANMRDADKAVVADLLGKSVPAKAEPDATPPADSGGVEHVRQD